ncbi:MAG: hypothetical protein CMF22_10285 [Idiomarinaceae bacterium]|nr:hypothetical protein [Idiomarinaceae bacterium]MBG23830.1 hypothetical protein [Idiomarinaceae bacterium]
MIIEIALVVSTLTNIALGYTLWKVEKNNNKLIMENLRLIGERNELKYDKPNTHRTIQDKEKP